MGCYSSWSNRSYNSYIVFYLLKMNAKKAVLLTFTGFLIIVTSIKLLLGSPDLLDRFLALFTVVVFFLDQLTR